MTKAVKDPNEKGSTTHPHKKDHNIKNKTLSNQPQTNDKWNILPEKTKRTNRIQNTHRKNHSATYKKRKRITNDPTEVGSVTERKNGTTQNEKR